MSMRVVHSKALNVHYLKRSLRRRHAIYNPLVYVYSLMWPIFFPIAAGISLTSAAGSQVLRNKMAVAYRVRKKQRISGFLGQIKDFDQSKLREDREQYITSPEVACEVLNWMESYYEDISRKFVVDLGCGTGMLSLGCSYMGAAHVVGMEVDEDAMLIAEDNLKRVGHECGSVDFVLCNVRDLTSASLPMVDTVVMNPPFGVHTPGFDYKKYRLHRSGRQHQHWKLRQKALPEKHDSGEGTDMVFLQKASEILSGNGSIYMFLLKSFRNEKHEKAGDTFLQRQASSLGLTVTSRLPGLILYDLPCTYSHHKKEEVNIYVDVIQFKKASP